MFGKELRVGDLYCCKESVWIYKDCPEFLNYESRRSAEKLEFLVLEIMETSTYLKTLLYTKILVAESETIGWIFWGNVDYDFAFLTKIC